MDDEWRLKAERWVDGLRSENALTIENVIARVVCNIPMNRLGELSGPVVAAALAAAGLETPVGNREAAMARLRVEIAYVVASARCDEYGFGEATNRIMDLVSPGLAERDAAVARANAEEIAHEETLAQRDRAEEWADKLAYAIAPMERIGEHSSGNCPWDNAHDLAVSIDAYEAAVARVAELEARWALLPERDRHTADAVATVTVPPGWSIEYGEGTRDIVLRHEALPHHSTFLGWRPEGWEISHFWTGRETRYSDDPQIAVDALVTRPHIVERIAAALASTGTPESPAWHEEHPDDGQGAETCPTCTSTQPGARHTGRWWRRPDGELLNQTGPCPDGWHTRTEETP